MDDEQKNNLRDNLADIQHKIWSHWMIYMFDQCVSCSNGDLLILTQDVERWRRQSKTEYQNLTDKEKKSDLDQVDKFWHLIDEIINDDRDLPTGQ